MATVTATAPATIQRIGIIPRLLVDAPINPMQYGQFIEYLADVVNGMWAERVSDCSFEGLGTWDWNFIKATDSTDRPWYPAGQVNRGEFTLDTEDPVSGAVSQRIRAQGGSPCTIGVAQDGIPFAQDEQLDLSCYLRGASSDGLATIELLDREGCVARQQFPLTTAWRKHTARMAPRRGCDNGTIRITFKGPGTLWIDNVSLMPLDTVGGWRRDVVEAVRAMRPGLIRFGGCIVDNTKDPKHFAWTWRSSVGDPDRRPPFWAWGGIQHTGPGLEEMVRFIRAVDAEPMLTVRVTNSTPQEAAEMVEYFNGSAATPMGRLRAANGQAEPHRVRYWQVGNELSGETYDRVLPEFCRAMREVDPGIVLFSSFPNDQTTSLSGGQVDYLCPHHYYMGDLAAVAADLDANARRCAAATRRTRLAITEWNLTAGDFGLPRAKLWTLSGALAGARYRNLLHRRCDMVEISNRSNMCNSVCTGAVQTDKTRMFLTPSYHVERLYATLAGDRVLQVAAPQGSDLDIGATYRGGAEPAVTLFLVNPSLASLPFELDLSGFTGLASEARTWTLADSERAGEPEVFNSFREPARIAPVEGRRRVQEGRLAGVAPALSLTVLRFGVAALP